MTSVTTYIGLGSNLDDPQAQVTEAIAELAGVAQSQVTACSSLYLSVPMGPQDQPHYVNAVVRMLTQLEPEALLDQMQAIEQAHDRERNQHWGPRTLDLDILLYGEEVIDTQRLKVPHPGLAERSFVLYPLAELDGGLEIPAFGSLKSLIERCPATGLTRLNRPLQSVGQTKESMNG